MNILAWWESVFYKFLYLKSFPLWVSCVTGWKTRCCLDCPHFCLSEGICIKKNVAWHTVHGNVTYRTQCDIEKNLSSSTAHFSPQIPQKWGISYFSFASWSSCCPKSLMQLFYEILHEKIFCDVPYLKMWRTVPRWILKVVQTSIILYISSKKLLNKL